MPQLGVSVVVLHEGRVLLTKREDFANWCLPGGGVDAGESIDQAAIREVCEETGIAITLTRLIGIASRPNWESGGTHVAVFAAVPMSNSFIPQASEVTELGFYDPQHLPHPFFWEHRRYIHDALAQTLGHVWVNPVQTPAIFPDRHTLYAWRDQLGVDRAHAYTELMRLCGRQRLEVRLGPNQGTVVLDDVPADSAAAPEAA